MIPRKTAIIIGAGPAGLTAAYELLTRTDITPIVLEKTEDMGGISRTVNYKGNRIDIGAHRFFSKSDRVMNWWLKMLPMEAMADAFQEAITNNGPGATPSTASSVPDPDKADRVMLRRSRKSRIYYRRRFFDYPIRLTLDTVQNLGFWRVLHIGLSYMRSVVFPVRPEVCLEDFLVNRFGRELYLTFFKSYTEKVWGVPCQQISAAWGAQRIKGLSIVSALRHALTPSRKTGISPKDTETSLIEQFLYPKFGAGQMWETVAGEIRRKGGQILTMHEATGLHVRNGQVVEVEARNTSTGETMALAGDYFFSTMPVKELVRCLDCPVPSFLREISEGLAYRDLITVGLLVSRFTLTEKDGSLIKDNWIYVQEEDVELGRLQIFNNWSPFMVATPGTVWLGLDYFCAETDSLWNSSDAEIVRLATTELNRLGMVDAANVLDSIVIRVPKTYPAYFGTFDRFAKLQAFLDALPNLYLVGRNGMHRYNNQDHSMLTAMVAVDNISQGITAKDNIWAVNTESDYHETK